MSEDIHRGSCFCKKVKYEISIDLSKGTYKCNCTYCIKTRQWGSSHVSTSALKIVEGNGELTKYVGNNPVNYFYFCKHCGTRIYTESYWTGEGTNAININTLDDIDRKQFSELTIHYIDGYNEVWEQEPEYSNFL